MREDIERAFLASASALGAKSPRIEEDDSVPDAIAEASSTVYSLYDDTEDRGEVHLASGMLSAFPNCCGIAVFGDADALPKWLKWIFELREAIARSENKGLAVQTHQTSNAATKRVMRQLHWRTTVPNWHNPNSGNRVTMWTKVLTKNAK